MKTFVVWTDEEGVPHKWTPPSGKNTLESTDGFFNIVDEWAEEIRPTGPTNIIVFNDTDRDYARSYLVSPPKSLYTIKQIATTYHGPEHYEQ